MAYLTEEELIERFEYYTIEIENKMREEDDLEYLLDKIPHAISLHHPQNFQHLYVNTGHVRMTGYMIEEMNESWEDYMQIVLPDSVQNIYNFLPDFYQQKSTNQTIAFVQYAKTHGKSEFGPLLTFTKPSSLADGTYLWVYLQPDNLSESSKKVEQIIQMDKFKLKHFKRFQQLTEREVEILKLLANGYNNPKIADKLFLSRSTVETHRKNLKRKLELKSLRDLMRYAFAFDLIEI